MLHPRAFGLYLTSRAIDNQAKLQNRFQAAFTKMTVLGHNVNDLIDCSEVIPEPPSFTGKATFPAGFTIADVEQAVRPSSICIFHLLTTVLPVRRNSFPYPCY